MSCYSLFLSMDDEVKVLNAWNKKDELAISVPGVVTDAGGVFWFAFNELKK